MFYTLIKCHFKKERIVLTACGLFETQQIKPGFGRDVGAVGSVKTERSCPEVFGGWEFWPLHFQLPGASCFDVEIR